MNRKLTHGSVPRWSAKKSANYESFRRLTDEQRAELAKSGEVEMVTGLQLLGKDKKLITELVELVNPPSAQ